MPSHLTQVSQCLKNPPASAGDTGLIPGSGRSPGEGNGNPLQYSCLGNPTDRRAGRLQSMGSQRVRYNLATKQQHIFFQLINLFWLEHNYFTILWWLLPHINMNQPQVYMCPPILNPPPTSFPTPSLWVVAEHHLWVSCFMHWPCTGHLFYIW